MANQITTLKFNTPMRPQLMAPIALSNSATALNLLHVMVKRSTVKKIEPVFLLTWLKNFCKLGVYWVVALQPDVV